MDAAQLFARYQHLQAYVGWDESDAVRVGGLRDLLDRALPGLIDDFYAEIRKHEETRRIITGGDEQIGRLKQTLLTWLRELLAGPYDSGYVERRWRIGWRHVEIGLDQVYTNAALSRLRTGLGQEIAARWPGPEGGRTEVLRSLDKLLDLDLAIIEDAYQAEHLRRQHIVERLAAIGQVAGGVAHELRNPLNVVKTSVYYLLHARNPTPEKTAEHLRRIEQHVGLADGVITALANFAKMPMPDLHPVPLRDCLLQTLEACTLSSHIDIRLDLPDDLPAALGDAAQLRIVFANLVRNARDAMPGGGQVTIAGRAVDGGVEVTVSDTGQGIPPENLSRIMEPLFSTKARGLGLGLSLARSILEKNRGQVSVSSEVGRGSTFTVRLCAHQAPSDKPPAAASPKEGVP